MTAGHLSQLDLARAIEQAVQEGAHIINVSGGELAPAGEPDPTLTRALQLCDAAERRSSSPPPATTAAIACTSRRRAHRAWPSARSPRTASHSNPRNWGDAYRANGLLAPGERIIGAVPGGGTASATGSSFATPIVTGVAALLLDIQRRAGRNHDPKAVRDALISSASPCHPPGAPECARYLAGTLNVPGAYALITRGGMIKVPEHASHPMGAAATAGGGRLACPPPRRCAIGRTPTGDGQWQLRMWPGAASETRA